MEKLPFDEYYCWEDFRSTKNFDVELWSHFQVAIKFGRIRWNRHVRCKHCRKLVGWSRCTGNLRKHIDHHHSETRNKPEGIKSKVMELAANPDEEYCRLLQRLIKVTFQTPSVKRITDDYRYGHELPRKGGKFPVWNFFMVSESTKRNVKCCLCQREIYWNQTGLEKLNRHVEKVHINCPPNVREEELYRFAIRLGIQKFLETAVVGETEIQKRS